MSTSPAVAARRPLVTTLEVSLAWGRPGPPLGEGLLATHRGGRGVLLGWLETQLGLRREPTPSVERVAVALDLVGLAPRWGNAAARLGNLDRLLELAREWEEQTLQLGLAPTSSGLVAHLDRLGREERDTRRPPFGVEGLTVLTSHRAKGLEWPVVVLTGSPTEREVDVFGIAVSGGDPGGEDPAGRGCLGHTGAFSKAEPPTMTGMLKRLWDGVLARSSALRRLRSRLWYQYLSRKLGDEAVLFMNYGYAHLDGTSPLELLPDDEPERTAAQLYHHVAGAVDVGGKDVIEVGCGRGGGASFVMRYLKPCSMLGVDHAEDAVGFARRRHRADGLRFTVGDAERLPAEDRSVDIVINVESSHCYGDMEQFAAEVERTLRPGGYLLFADLGDRIRMARVREAFMRSGLDVVREEKINANVLKAMEQDSDKKLGQVKRFAPWFLRGAAKEFAGLTTSAVYRMLHSEEILYMHFVLQKREECSPACSRPD